MASINEVASLFECTAVIDTDHLNDLTQYLVRIKNLSLIIGDVRLRTLTRALPNPLSPLMPRKAAMTSAYAIGRMWPSVSDFCTVNIPDSADWPASTRRLI